MFERKADDQVFSLKFTLFFLCTLERKGGRTHCSPHMGSLQG